MTYAIPPLSLLTEEPYHYVDSFDVSLSKRPEILDVARSPFLSTPKWIVALMSLRNKIVKHLDLKTSDTPGDHEAILRAFDGKVGSSIGLFRVFAKSENEIVFGQNDSHLNFRASLLLEDVGEKLTSLHFTTTVEYVNWTGRLYFLIVKPFHKVIVKRMLQATKVHLEKGY